MYRLVVGCIGLAFLLGSTAVFGIEMANTDGDWFLKDLQVFPDEARFRVVDLEDRTRPALSDVVKIVGTTSVKGRYLQKLREDRQLINPVTIPLLPDNVPEGTTVVYSLIRAFSGVEASNIAKYYRVEFELGQYASPGPEFKIKHDDYTLYTLEKPFGVKFDSAQHSSLGDDPDKNVFPIVYADLDSDPSYTYIRIKRLSIQFGKSDEDNTTLIDKTWVPNNSASNKTTHTFGTAEDNDAFFLNLFPYGTGQQIIERSLEDPGYILIGDSFPSTHSYSRYKSENDWDIVYANAVHRMRPDMGVVTAIYTWIMLPQCFFADYDNRYYGINLLNLLRCPTDITIRFYRGKTATNSTEEALVFDRMHKIGEMALDRNSMNVLGLNNVLFQYRPSGASSEFRDTMLVTPDNSGGENYIDLYEHEDWIYCYDVKLKYGSGAENEYYLPMKVMTSIEITLPEALKVFFTNYTYSQTPPTVHYDTTP